MKRSGIWIAALALSMGSGTAMAQITANASVTNNYLWRGLTQTINSAAVQGGLDWGWWSSDYRVTSESLPGNQISNARRKWDVAVPANGETTLTVEYQTRF